MVVSRSAALVALAMATAAEGCGGGGGGGSLPDAAGGSSGSSGGMGGDAGVSGGGTGGSAIIDAAGTDADATLGDAASIDPAEACDQPLDVTPYSCTSKQGQIAPVLGGEIPQGTYDRIEIVSPLPGECDARSSLLLSGGVYKLQFEALGGPFVSGGAYSVNSATGQLFFTTHCGDGNPGYFYEYSAAEKKLTLFPDNFTGWVYVLRE